MRFKTVSIKVASKTNGGIGPFLSARTDISSLTSALILSNAALVPAFLTTDGTD